MAKKKLKTVIVKRAKSPKFDLSFTKTNENVKIIMAIESLKSNVGWQFLSQIFNENIKDLATKIITKTEDGKLLSDAEVDILRSKHNYLKEIMDKPAKILKQLQKTDTVDEDLDPYEK